MQQQERLFRPEGEGEAYDASDPEAIKKAEAAANLRLEQRRQVADMVLNSKPGREWLFSMLKDTGVFVDPVLTDNEYANGYAAGQLHTGMSMLRMFCRSNPEKFGLMVKENDHG